jgi:RNA polymerase sigma-70 factor (ECF subfamily)
VLEDRLLIKRFNAGDAQALRRIYEKYRLDLLAVARALAHDPATVEDVLHDVPVGFASQSGRFKLTGSLKGYLAVCVANRARNANRRVAQARKCHAVQAGASYVHDPAEAAGYAEAHLALREAMAQLPPEQREVLVLHVLGAMRFREIASRTGQSINTVQSRYRYALQTLRTQLNGWIEI